MTARYRRVPHNEPEEEETNKKLRAQRIEKINAKIHALLWVLLAAALAYFTDFFTLLLSDKVNRVSLNIMVACLSAVMCIFFYLSIWLPLIMRVHAPWSLYCPNMIPAASALSTVAFIAFIVAFWPVWGLLSPLFATFLTMGLLFSAHFIPWPC